MVNKYNITTIEEHTITTDFLNEQSWILDLGCLNFKFANYFKNVSKNIICVDANPRITSENGIIEGFPIPDDIIFINKAVVGDEKKEHIEYYVYHDINGNSVYKNEHDYAPLIEKIEVESITINDIMSKYQIRQFDLIKFDIEGSEYDILRNLDFTISKQFSIEFHDFRNFNIDLNDFYYHFNKKITEFCDVIQHELTQHPGWPTGSGINHWDSLFVLKKDYWL